MPSGFHCIDHHNTQGIAVHDIVQIAFGKGRVLEDFGKDIPVIMIAHGEMIGDFTAFHFTLQQRIGPMFTMFDKIDVNGDNTHPLYAYLKNEATGVLGSKAIKWNFTKFLINRDGKVIKRYAPTDKPEAIRKDIEKLL